MKKLTVQFYCDSFISGEYHYYYKDESTDDINESVDYYNNYEECLNAIEQDRIEWIFSLFDTGWKIIKDEDFKK